MDIKQTYDGGYIIIGTDNSFTNNSNHYVIKIDSSGTIEWEKTYGVPAQWDAAYSIIQTPDSGYAFTGYLNIGGWNYDIALVKLNQQGDTLWTQTYGTGASIGYDVAQTYDGGYIITGSVFIPAKYQDMCIIKTNAQGDSIWGKVYGDSTQFTGEQGWAVQQTSDSNYIAAGTLYANGQYNIFLVKLDNNGDTLWTKAYPYGEYGDVDVKECSDGGLIICGLGEYATFKRLYLVKTDANGDTLWTKKYGGTYAYKVEPYSIDQCSDGGYIISGTHYLYDINQVGLGRYFHLIRTDANGDTLWTRTFDGVKGKAFDIAYAVQQTNDGGYIAAGNRYMSIITGHDVFVVKTDSMGNVYPITGVEQQTVADGQLLIYPNPFRERATIVASTMHGITNYDVAVYDIVGRQVKSYPVIGQQQLTIKARDIGTGIFFVQLRNKAEVLDTKKIVVLR